MVYRAFWLWQDGVGPEGTRVRFIARMVGEDYEDDFGKNIATLGDINGDGQNDIVFSCESANTPKSGLMWLSRRKGVFDGDWQAHDISGPKGIKYDRMELLDVDKDGDLDILTCEERENGKGLGLFWYENPHERAGR